jgi:hypothetical protein
MSDQSTRMSPAARVIEVDRADEVRCGIEPAAQVIVTERTERVTPERAGEPAGGRAGAGARGGATACQPRASPAAVFCRLVAVDALA